MGAVRAARPGTDGAVPAPPPRDPALVRNVALVGHSGAGKTTLAEALLAAAGAVPRAGDVQDGTTVCDSDEVERRLGRSVALAVAPLEHRGVTVNLLVTPGDPDFAGGLRAGLRAADAALFVVSAAGGLDAVTAQLWAECEGAGVPRAVVVTQLDRARADFDEAVALCQRLLSEDVLPLHLPMHDDDGSVAGLIALLDQVVVDHSSGSREERAPDPEHLALVADLRADLVETVLAESEDDTLLDRYLDGEELPGAVLRGELETAVARGHVHPALAAAPLTGVGLHELLDLLVAGFPSPRERPCPPVSRPDGSPAAPLECDPAGPLAAEVVRTTTDPHAGRVSYVRVLSGTLRADVPVVVAGHGAGLRTQERIASVASPLGAALRPVEACAAGDVCAVLGLTTARTGDTLSSPDEPLLLSPWALPEPQLPVAVRAADADRLVTAIEALVAEDAVARVEQRTDTGQLLLWCTGPGHADVLLQRLRERVGAEVETDDVVVPHRETLAGPATATGRSSGAEVVLAVTPGEPGSGVSVRTRDGAAVPAALQQAVLDQAARGVGDRGPLVDVAVVLLDSSAPADGPAAAAALREAAAAAGTVLLEPWWQLEVRVPSAFARTVASDLRGRRARAVAHEPDPEGDTLDVVRAQLPEAELLGYAAALRGVSYGTGSFTRRPLGFEPQHP